MASKTQALVLLLSLFSVSVSVSFIVKSSQADGQIAVYWGQNVNEGSLRDARASENYDIVLLAFLNVFGAGRNPAWDFAGHCGDWSPCTKLGPEIEYCQSLNKKVFLSLGGAFEDYSIASAEDAKEVARYLWDDFLSGQYGPLGSVSLDGTDFDIEGGSNLHWDDVAKELYACSKAKALGKVSSASPENSKPVSVI